MNLTILHTSGLLASSTTTLIGSDAVPAFAPLLLFPLLSQEPKEPVDLIFASPPFPLELEDENKAEINPEGESLDNVELTVFDAAGAGEASIVEEGSG
jgi:16S rRNA G966 N2-methylase RsmD